MKRYLGLLAALWFTAIAIAGLTSQSRAQQPAPAAAAAPQGGRGRGGATPVTIHAARVFDGKGGVIQDGVVTVQGNRITAV